MKQLDVVASPPAFLWDPYLTLTDVIFDLDRQTDRRKATHKSPPCMSTGGLKNECTASAVCVVSICVCQVL